MTAAGWVPLAEVARPHGVWGEVRLKVYNADSELLFDQAEVLVRTTNGRERMMRVESLRGADAGFLLAKLGGVETRDDAELLRGAAICVERARFPELEEGEFYVCDVIGARLVGAARGEVGVVENLVSYPTSDVLVVRRGTSIVELPLVEDFIDRVDTGQGEVVLTTEGLTFFDEASGEAKRHAN
jgi:16S rRNA processing protein RimM